MTQIVVSVTKGRDPDVVAQAVEAAGFEIVKRELLNLGYFVCEVSEDEVEELKAVEGVADAKPDVRRRSM